MRYAVAVALGFVAGVLAGAMSYLAHMGTIEAFLLVLILSIPAGIAAMVIAA